MKPRQQGPHARRFGRRGGTEKSTKIEWAATRAMARQVKRKQPIASGRARVLRTTGAAQYGAAQYGAAQYEAAQAKAGGMMIVLF
jgi:hypothetical protein